MEETNMNKYENQTMATLERTPLSFVTLCRLIKNQTLTYDEAWCLVKDIITANTSNQCVDFK